MNTSNPLTGRLAVPRTTFASTAIMTDALRAEIAERLLDGEVPDQVARWLTIKGFDAPTIKQELDIATRDPFYRGTLKLQQRLMKRDWQLGLYRRLAALAPQAGEVSVETAISPEDFLSRYYATNRPVLLRDMIGGWPAMAKWHLDYVEARAGDPEVSVQWGRESDPDYERNKPVHRRIVPFSTLLERLRSGEPSNDYYLTASNSDDNSALVEALWDDVGDLPGILAPQAGGRHGFLWMGPEGTITPFHHDLTNNLLVQLRGRKRVKLVAAWDAALMKNDSHCFSRWTGEDLQPGEPKRGRPRVLELELEPGDALFIPVGWWHHVVALDLTIGLSFTHFAWPNDHTDDYASYGEM